MAHERFYEKLSDCQINKIEVDNVSLKTYKLTRPTEEQKELLERVGLTKLLSQDTFSSLLSYEKE